MNDFPIQVILMPLLAFAVVGIMLVNRKRALKSQDTQFKQFRAGELAQRLGLSLVKGDPAFNLFIRQASVDVDRGPSDKKPVHVEVLLEGERDGLPMSLRYLYRVEQQTGVGKVTWKIWHDCRLTVTAAGPFPEFELVSRKAPMGPIARKLNAPAQPIGERALDATYEVVSAEPGVAEALRDVLPAFSTFVNSGVHLIGDETNVSFVMKQDKAPLLANALYYAEDMATAVTSVARALGG